MTRILMSCAGVRALAAGGRRRAVSRPAFTGHSMFTMSSWNAGQTPHTELTPSSHASIGRSLSRRFEIAVANPSAEAMAALQVETTSIARAMRAAGFTPERAVIAMKALLRGHATLGWMPSLVVDLRSGSAAPESPVYQELFGWWLSAFFAERS